MLFSTQNQVPQISSVTTNIKQNMLFFHAKSGSTNIHRNGLSDISLENPFSFNLIKFKKIKFWSNFELIRQPCWLTLAY